ncbi:uncharacterized protein KY384_001533 [Bacidia gigantensis]|uniref:uncharacterized protein n=1 Tax=Bacidia gigantensis TaxID=2732470 RepID=UPI001D055833|nr:uncharacterized protein KY384_001533 [Bacidia gigantensis]KAG8533792.1 hypothetical protein KY384_001533 [Bacidia gigantensis]
MVPLVVPVEGLILPPDPTTSSEDDEMNLSQVIQLDLENGMLYDLMKAARHGVRGPQLSFGKSISLHYGSKTRALSSSLTSFPSYLYTSSGEHTQTINYAGQLSHQLELQKAKKEIAGADDALAKLQSSLASEKEAKQSHQIKFVPDSSNLPPAKKQTVASLRQGHSKGGSLSFLKKNKESITRSMPSSPAIGPFRPPVSSNPIPKSTIPLSTGRAPRAQAIRKSLIHLLASCSHTTKKLAQQLCCKEEDILLGLSKVGKGIGEDQWDLKDSIFKELDVWKFPYTSNEERESAIDRAVSAFDRMRLSSQDILFQKLLAKEERGKGKSLSRLNHLNKGPIQHSSTPRIHVHNSDEPGKRSSEGEEDRKSRPPTQGKEPSGRSKSHEATKKTKASEKEAQSKRLLSKGPKKIAPLEKDKEGHPAGKKGVKKVNTPLSSEFVHDSDEEDGLEESIVMQSEAPNSDGLEVKPEEDRRSHAKSKLKRPVPSRSDTTIKLEEAGNTQTKKSSRASTSGPSNGTTKPKPREAVSERSSPNKSAVDQHRIAQMTAQKAPTKKPEVSKRSAPTSKPKPSDDSQGSAPLEAKVSRSRNTSSPHKPSPLASSPPANASDMDENGESSASSTPLMDMKDRDSQDKAEKSSAAFNAPERVVKRKISQLEISSQGRNSGLLNGHSADLPNGRVKPSKRPRTSELTPPSSNSPSPPPAISSRASVLTKAQDFKDRYYPKYTKLYHQLETADSPDPDKVAELWKMHDRLAAIKVEIKAEWLAEVRHAN